MFKPKVLIVNPGDSNGLVARLFRLLGSTANITEVSHHPGSGERFDFVLVLTDEATMASRSRHPEAEVIFVDQTIEESLLACCSRIKR